MEQLQQEIDSLNEKVAQLEEIINSFFNSSTIPFDVDAAFTDRFLKKVPNVSGSTKSASSENQPVNEGGIATYSVLKPPDRFLQVVVSGKTEYIPVYD